MADTKISALTDGATAAATDKIPVERGGANRYITPAYLAVLAETLTNKRITKRVTTVASSTTSVTIDVSATDVHVTTAQAEALLYNNPTGSPTEGQGLLIRIKDNGTARALTWDTQFRAGDTALPTTTVLGKTMYLAFIFNSTDTKWDFTGKQGGF